jgi:hypothetical protein
VRPIADILNHSCLAGRPCLASLKRIHPLFFESPTYGAAGRLGELHPADPCRAAFGQPGGRNVSKTPHTVFTGGGASWRLEAALHYEIWAVHSGNRVARAPSEAEALRVVRGLLQAGWKAEDLLFGAEPDEGEPADLPLPPVLQGNALEQRALQYV